MDLLTRRTVYDIIKEKRGERMRPNVLFFFADQFRFDAIAAHGNPHIKTPNLDRLIREGVTFTNAYTPSPVCVAARCSLHYGQYPIHTNCYENSKMPEDGRLSYVDALTRAGYRTHAIGKCHFSPDKYALRGYESREYQEEIGFKDMSRENYMNDLIAAGFDYCIEPHGVRSEMYYIPQPARMPQRLHPTQWIGDRTMAFLDEQKVSDRPWYLFSSFIHPHPPFAPPSPWHTLYRSEEMPLPKLPENYEGLQIFINKIQNRSKYKNRGWDEHLLRTMKAYYYACVSFVDYQIGRVIERLEENGQLENTLILFASDHGELLGDYGCFGKRSMHDAAAHIPLIARGGDFVGGKRCDTPVSLVDIAPTLISIGGADRSDMLLDGKDLVGIFCGDQSRRGVYSFFSSKRKVQRLCGKENFDFSDEAWDFAGMNMMYAERDLKYFYSFPDDKEILFDNASDPEQTKNYASERPEELAYMRGELIKMLEMENKAYFTEGGKFNPPAIPIIPENPDWGLIHQDFAPEYFDFSVLDGYK